MHVYKRMRRSRAAALVLVTCWAVALVLVVARVQVGGRRRWYVEGARRGRGDRRKEGDGVPHDGFKTLRFFLEKSKYTALIYPFGRREYCKIEGTVIFAQLFP